jgi:hypothetical protein
VIDITHIQWNKRAIGIALRKLHTGNNAFRVTAKDFRGAEYYPGTFAINREEAIKKYGVSVINKHNLSGLWIPLDDLEGLRYDVQKGASVLPA